MVRRLVIIGMSVCVVPDDGDVAQEAKKHCHFLPWGGPRRGSPVAGASCSVQCPASASRRIRVGGGVEVDNVLRLLGLIVTAYHVEIEITFHLADERTALYKVFEPSNPFSSPSQRQR